HYSSDRSLFSTIRTLPSSTLFPYTTLFRSLGGEAVPQPRVEARRDHGRGRRKLGDARSPGRPPAREGGAARLRFRTVGSRRHRRDRKSTRLNSSHVAISYAVFCLKKKKSGR